MQSEATSSKQWHVTNWGLLGWLETAVKGIGILLAFVAFVDSLGADKFIIGDNPHLAAVILLGLLALGMVAPLGLRYIQKEIISMAYAVFNFLGHAALFLALVRQPDQEIYAILFGAAYIIGEIIKQRFLTTTGYTEAGQSPKAMLNFSRGVIAAYALLIILVLI